MPTLAGSNPTNDPGKAPVKSSSKFKPNYSRYDTQQYGLNTPFLAIPAVPGDDISIRARFDTDTYSLKAPLMQPIKRHLMYSQVPLRAILPNGADLIVTNPRVGDDVDVDKVNCIISTRSANYFASVFINQFGSALNETMDASKIRNFVRILLRSYQVFYPIYGAGSLPRYLGMNFDSFEMRYTDEDEVQHPVAFDELFERLFSALDTQLSGLAMTVTFDKPSLSISSERLAGTMASSRTTYVYFGNKPEGSEALTFRELLSLIMEYPVMPTVTYMPSFPDVVASQTIFSRLFGLTDSSTTLSIVLNGVSKPINVGKLLAYQLTCAEFLTNDKVDGVYSTDLFHQNTRGILNLILGYNSLVTSAATYLLNGVPVMYDTYSGFFMNNETIQDALNNYVGYSNQDIEYYMAFAYWHNLFSFTRSLKYEDYFVGAKVRPLAVGDQSVGVDTQSNTVDVIDITKNIQLQRFRNQVNRIGRKIREYTKGIFDTVPMADPHCPIYLGHVTDYLGAEETDNTGDAQVTQPNSTTSKLRSNSDRYLFQVHTGEFSYILGIVFYDLPRVYADAVDRDVFHYDRFDMFNPYMQFIGDQEIYGCEIMPDQMNSFGYQMRYNEYKQNFDKAAGGFLTTALPGYAKIVRSKKLKDPTLDPSKDLVISSDFIRSHVSDIDEFYLSLTGYVPGYRFHFINRIDLDVTAKRPMVFAPEIL